MKKTSQKKRQTATAQKAESHESVSMELFLAYQEEFRARLDSYEQRFEKLENAIMEVSRQKENLAQQISEKDEEIKILRASLDSIDRNLKITEGGFILGGKDYREIDGKEYGHFQTEFQEKMYEVARSKEITLPKVKFELDSSQIGSSPNFLTKIATTNPNESTTLELFVSNQLVKATKGEIKWKGLDGKDRKAYLKPNRSFIDRKISRLMYLVFSSIEKDTGEKVVKEWKNGMLLLNGVAVEISRLAKKVQAKMQGTIVAEVNLV